MREGKRVGGVSNNWDWVRNNMSARASYARVSNWSTSKFKGSHTSSKLNAVCLTGTVTPSRHVRRPNLHPAESVPVKGTSFYFGGDWDGKNHTERCLTGEG